MPEPATTVAEIPPEVKERQETDAYIEQRKAEKAAPPPEVKIETTTPAQAAAEPPKEPEILRAQKEVNEVDAFIRERDYKIKQKRGKRSGIQAKIDEVAKLATELKEKLNAPPPEPAKPAEVKPAEAPKPVETPKAAPKMSDYTDIDKYNADMALWAAANTKSVPAEPPKEVLKGAPKPEPISELRKEEFDRFLEAGKRYVLAHPDFNTTLEAAHIRGLTMSERARVAITRLAAPEVAYWLAKPENDLAARTFMKLDDEMQAIEIGKIAERLSVRPSDFVSNAPPPGTRLNGQTRSEVPLSEITDTDEYIRQRRQARRTGARR